MLEGTESKVVTEKELLRLLSPLINKPFPPKQSPWEYLYIPNFLPLNESNTVSILVKRIHHSIGDGYSLMKSFIAYECGDSVDKFHSPKKEDRKMSNKLSMKEVVETARQLVMIPYDLPKHLLTIDSNPWFLRKKSSIEFPA